MQAQVTQLTSDCLIRSPRNRISSAIIFSRPTLSTVEYSSGYLLF